MNFKRNNNDDKKILLKGSVSDDVKLQKRADLLFNNMDTDLDDLVSDFSYDNRIADYNISGLGDGVQPLSDTRQNNKTGFSKDLKQARKEKIQEIKKNNLKPAQYVSKNPSRYSLSKLKSGVNDFVFNTADNIIDKNYDTIGSLGARVLGGYEADQNLKMAFAENYLDTDYARSNTVLNGINDVDTYLREVVKEKINQQLGSEYVNKIKGIFFDSDSYTSQRLAQNSDIMLFIKENKEFLKAYGSIKEGSVQFTDSNFYNAIGKADIFDMYLTNDNEIVFYIIDTYDFNKNSSNAFVRAGKKHQQLERLIPYFMIYSVKIDKYTTARYLQ